jgi:hypothetical protein
MPVVGQCGIRVSWRACPSGFLLATCRTGALPMSSLSFRTLQSVCLIAVVLAGQSAVFAQEPPLSLTEKKLRMIRGTAGIVIYGGEKEQAATAPTPALKPAPAPAAASSPTPTSALTAVPTPAAAKSEAQTQPSAESTPQAAAKSGPLSDMQKPSSRSFNDLRRFGIEGEGIAIPTSPTPPKPHADPWAKP